LVTIPRSSPPGFFGEKVKQGDLEIVEILIEPVKHQRDGLCIRVVGQKQRVNPEPIGFRLVVERLDVRRDNFPVSQLNVRLGALVRALLPLRRTSGETTPIRPVRLMSSLTRLRIIERSQWDARRLIILGCLFPSVDLGNAALL
jgi:hypothetical protein